MRDPQQLPRVTDGESEFFGERQHRPGDDGARTLLLALRTRPRHPLADQESPDGRGEADVVHEARAAGIPHEKAERLPDPLARLVDGAPVAVAPFTAGTVAIQCPDSSSS
jgi:hypothetical protein